MKAVHLHRCGGRLQLRNVGGPPCLAARWVRDNELATLAYERNATLGSCGGLGEGSGRDEVEAPAVRRVVGHLFGAPLDHLNLRCTDLPQGVSQELGSQATYFHESSTCVWKVGCQDETWQAPAGTEVTPRSD